MAVEWFYQAFGQTHGPVSGARLRSLARRGTVTPETHVSRGAEGKWGPARLVKGLFGQPSAETPQPPPAPPKSPPPLPPPVSPGGELPENSPSSTAPEVFDPYYRWLGIPPKEQPPNHYRLLGIETFESHADVIANAADRQMLHVRSFQSGERSEACQQILNRIATARVCLLDPMKKGQYDCELRKEQSFKLQQPLPMSTFQVQQERELMSRRSASFGVSPGTAAGERPIKRPADTSEGGNEAGCRRSINRTSWLAAAVGAIGIVVIAGILLAIRDSGSQRGPLPPPQGEVAPAGPPPETPPIARRQTPRTFRILDDSSADEKRVSRKEPAITSDVPSIDLALDVPPQDEAGSTSDLPEVDNPFAAPTDQEMQADGPVTTSDIEAPSIDMALTGREEGAKEALLDRYGGTAVTQEGVRRGLVWLGRNQLGNGSWSLSGPYGGGISQDFDNRVAATAMALLAFQGDGHTPQKDKFKPNVVRGWKWLLSEQDKDGCFFHEGAFNQQFYTQGMCTIAVCELYGMTKDPKYKEPAERAVKYCLESQSPEGGWRYAPRSESDVSVTGWIVMALQSARMAGLEVPEENLQRVQRFLDKVGREDGSRYPYQRDGEIRLSMTAEALLCRQYLGWDRDDPRLVAGVEWITAPENLVDFNKNRDAYTWYYATQVAHHMEGDYWKRWNAVMRQVVPEQQVKRGRESGSWDPEKPTMDKWAPHGGRLYVTCLSLYMLEVYYRHLPIYAKVYTNLLKSGRTDRR